MNEAKIFKSVRQANQHAAYQVACYWLQSANRILDRGDIPCKLSQCAQRIARDEMDRPIYGKYAVRMDSADIARHAIQLALAKLYAGQFVRVSGHFKVGGDNDSRRFCLTLLESVGEIKS